MNAYTNAEGRTAFKCADSIGVIEVRAKDTDDGCEYVIFWYIDRIDKGHKTIKRIQVWDKENIYFYVQVQDGKIELDTSVELNPRPHTIYIDPHGKKYGKGLGYIPFWRLDNNLKQFSGLKTIKSLIDDYDLMACSLSNNLQDFTDALYVVSGFQGDNLDEMIQNIKAKKHIGVGDGGGVDIKTIDIPYQARQAKLDLDEKNIYRFGMGFNSAQLGDGNIPPMRLPLRSTCPPFSRIVPMFWPLAIRSRPLMPSIAAPSSRWSLTALKPSTPRMSFPP